MRCVVKSSKEFKNLATKHNVDHNTLELIIHKYWKATGNEELFPSDVYIQAQLGNSQYLETGPNVIKLWQKDYSSPMTFNSMEEFNAAHEEALKYFPSEAVIGYKNTEGKPMLAVKQPVETLSTKQQFFDSIDENKDTLVTPEEKIKNNLNKAIRDLYIANATNPKTITKEYILNELSKDNRTDEINLLNTMSEEELSNAISYAKQMSDDYDRVYSPENNHIQFAIDRHDNWGKKQYIGKSESKYVKEHIRFNPNTTNYGTVEGLTTLFDTLASKEADSAYISTEKHTVSEADFNDKYYDAERVLAPYEIEHDDQGHFTTYEEDGNITISNWHYYLLNLLSENPQLLEAAKNPYMAEALINGVEVGTDIETYLDSHNVADNIEYAYSDARQTELFESVEGENSNQEITSQLIDHLKSMGLTVFGRTDMEQYLKDHSITNLQQVIETYDKNHPYHNEQKASEDERKEILSIIKSNKYNNPGTDIVVLDNNDTIFLVDHSSDKELYKNLAENEEKGIVTDCYGIRNTFNRKNLNADILRFIIRNLAKGSNYSERSVYRKLSNFGLVGEHLSGINIAAELKMVHDYDAGLLSPIQEAEYNSLNNRYSSNGRTDSKSSGHQGETQSSSIDEFVKTPQGEVYGFVDKDGNIYLDETTISPEHPIHEYTHLWDRAVAKQNPKLWKRGVDLMKQTYLWNEILNDANYGQQWASMGISGERLESLIASEVHSRLTGKEGAQLLNKISKEKGGNKLVQRLKEWFNDMFASLKKTFGKWTDKDLDNLTLEEFNNMTLRDFSEGINPNTATVTEESSSVSLPGLQKYNNASTAEITVDAEWKIPVLEHLDAKLQNLQNLMEGDNTARVYTTYSRIKSLVNRIQDVLNAKSEDADANSLSARIQRNLEKYEKFNTQLNNLLDSTIISPTEVREISEQIMNSISDMITDIQTGTVDVAKIFPNIKSQIDFTTASRKEIVEAIGIDNLLERTKTLFDVDTEKIDDLDAVDQAQLIIENWDALIDMAADIFAFNEGFGISRNMDKGSYETSETEGIDVDNFNDYSNDVDAAAEEGEKDEQEHWQVESRTIGVLTSMSDLVRQGLRECYLLDSEGNEILSKWGVKQRVNPKEAVSSILRWTQGSMSLPHMVEKLKEKQSQNPWLSKLIERLTVVEGRENPNADFQSQFYSVFQKHFQLYSIVLLENGTYKSIPVNEHPAMQEAMQTITTKYQLGEMPLVNSNGEINQSVLGKKTLINENDKFNLYKAQHVLESAIKTLDEEGSLDNETMQNVVSMIVGVCHNLGYTMTPEAIQSMSGLFEKENISTMASALKNMIRDLENATTRQINNPGTEYNPFEFKGNENIRSSVKKFLTPITEVMDDVTVNAFYDSGKMYQSYIIPSFMTKLFNKFRTTNAQEFQEFIESEYANSEWFKIQNGDIDSGWRNEWLRLLVTDKEARKIFSHKVELKFDKHNYMRNMTDAEYALSVIAEYFTEESTNDEVPAWFRVPMQSNKPSSEFIKFYSYRGNNYQEKIIEGFYDIFLQEADRIQTVLMRGKQGGDKSFIKNFDTNGRMFQFLPFLNTHLSDNTEFAQLLQKRVNGNEKLTKEEAAKLSVFVRKAIENHLNQRSEEILDNWEKDGILQAAMKIEHIVPNMNKLSKKEKQTALREALKNFIWNDSLASKYILQLTVGDIAFYKDTEDLQKRLAQLHAPGMRGNIYATDYAGNKVSKDGKYRTIIIKDFDNFQSNIIANIAEVFDRRIAEAPEDQKGALIALKDSLVRPPKTQGKDDKGGKYWQINVADAQGYSSPTSYRKKALMFGKWSREAEDIYQKLLKGEYTYTDLEVAFQPLKPFVYTHTTKDMGMSNAPIKTVNVPFQAKNAEYLLIMADALLKNEQTSRPNILKAVYRIMEDSAYDGRTYDADGKIANPGTYNGRGIDTVQFESAIKSGLQTPLDLSDYYDDAISGEERTYNYLKQEIYKAGTTEYDVTSTVHEASFEDYCLQQEVPEHFKNHFQAHGSQIRAIIPSDLSDIYHDETGAEVTNYYEWDDPVSEGKKNHRKVTAREFKKEYEQNIADNIQESIDALKKELFISLDSNEPVTRLAQNIALSNILIKEILSSPRYGIDLAQACQIDPETGEFRIPKGDPIQAKRIEQLINSIIKNRINKQKIAGGPIVQVSNYGTSTQLHIRFKDKEGNIIPLESEYNPAEHNNQSYKEYLKENQDGIAHFEVFLPIWDGIENFINEDGTVDIEAIERTDPELLKMISYRIPTEDKYSMAPMKCVGFMPREAGDAIMLPYELTEIDDSDFDVDKRYVMRKNLSIIIDRQKAAPILKQMLIDSYKQAHNGEISKSMETELKNAVENYFNTYTSKNAKKYWGKLEEYIDASLEKLRKTNHDIYKTVTPTEGRDFRDNKIIDMSWAVLTNRMTADKILNPGGFDAPKKMGYMVAAYKNPNNSYSWEELSAMDINALKKLSYIDKDLTWIDTQVQFYKQNSAAASLIGVFAVNKVAHALLEGNRIFLDIEKATNSDLPITICNNVLAGRREIDKTTNHQGDLIGKILGSLVSASADAVKDPILNLMNVNMTTAGMLNTMLRLGMSFEDSALFLSQSTIENVLKEFNTVNLTQNKSLGKIIDDYLRAYEQRVLNSDEGETSKIQIEGLDKPSLIEGLKNTDSSLKNMTVHDYKVLYTFRKLQKLTEAMRKPTFATRFNSISSAVGPLIVDNLITDHKIEGFTEAIMKNGSPFYTATGESIDIYDIFRSHPMLQKFADSFSIASQLFRDMPAGSTAFKAILDNMPKSLSEKLYSDKKLLDKFSNFYQSYLLVKSGLINQGELVNYIGNGKDHKGFAEYYVKQGFDEKYPDNALIQAIKPRINKSTGTPYLQINLSGLDEQSKEKLRTAWIDLHKENPDLSYRLFAYSFFRGGVGFSPKTFMALVPTYVKEHLERNGASYVDTYRHLPTIPNSTILVDQFVRNNWDDNTLVPIKGDSRNSNQVTYMVDKAKNQLVINDENTLKDLKGTDGYPVYFKKAESNGYSLWKLSYESDNMVMYKGVKPLGNNGEYLEISTYEIDAPLNDTILVIQDNETSDITGKSQAEAENETTSDPLPQEGTTKEKKLHDLVTMIMDAKPMVGSREVATQRIEEFRDGKNLWKFFKDVFQKNNIQVETKDDVITEFEKYC